MTDCRECGKPYNGDEMCREIDPWIPCHVRQPEKWGSYRVTILNCNNERVTYYCQYEPNHKHWNSLHVIAWQENPAPWEGEVK